MQDIKLIERDIKSIKTALPSIRIPAATKRNLIDWHMTKQENMSPEEYAADELTAYSEDITYSVPSVTTDTKNTVRNVRDLLRRDSNQPTKTTGNTSHRAVRTVKNFSSTAKTVKTVQHAPKNTTQTIQKTAKTAQKTAETSAKAARAASVAAQRAAQAAVEATKAIARAIVAAAKALYAAIQELAELIASTEGVAAIVILVIIVIVLLIGGFCGIYFSGEEPDIGSTDLVLVAQSQLGNVGGEPYWSWYGFHNRVEWCACFVSWCADQCGYIDAGIIPKFSSCTDGSDWLKERGLWRDKNYVPSPGDLIFFDWDDDIYGQNGLPNHVGIVEKVEDGIIHTIEGNADDVCKRNQYVVGYYEILGYGLKNNGLFSASLFSMIVSSSQ